MGIGGVELRVMAQQPDQEQQPFEIEQARVAISAQRAAPTSRQAGMTSTSLARLKIEYSDCTAAIG